MSKSPSRNKRPAAVRALDAAQIGGDAGFEHGIDRFAEIVAQQHVFGRNGGVGFELEQKMTVGALAGEQRLRGSFDMPIEIDLAHWRVRFARRDEFGGAVAGSDRAFDGGGQAGIRPIAGKQEIAPRGLGAGPL